MAGNPFGWGTNLLATLSRPPSVSDPRVLGSVDDWAQDCSSPSAQDGTEMSAEQANEVVGNLRAVLRVNGYRIDGVTPVVAEDHSDVMLAKSLQNLVQRARTNFAIDTGAADAIVANPAFLPTELLDGMEFTIKVGHANATTSPTANIGATGAKPIKRPDGSAPVANDILATYVRLRYDQTNDVWRLTSLAASAVSFPPGATPIHLVGGQYVIDRATLPTTSDGVTSWNVGVGHCATPAEIAARATAAGSDGPAFLRADDIPLFANFDPWGTGLGSIVTIPSQLLTSNVGQTSPIGLTVTASQLNTAGDGEPVSQYPGGSWGDIRKGSFAGTWTCVNYRAVLDASSGIESGVLVFKRTA